MGSRYAIAACAAAAIVCNRAPDEDFLGSAVVESLTWKAAATVPGPVTDVLKREGERVKAGEVVARLDTVPLSLKARELDARESELRRVIVSRRSEIASLEEEIRGIAREYGRIGELADKGSVPMQQKDDLGTKMKAADHRLAAARGLLASMGSSIDAVEAQRAQLADQISRCRILAPASGVVLARYRNAGEFLGAGMPVMEIGALDTVYADFHVPQVLLSRITYGQAVRIRLDGPGGTSSFLAATVSWIADEAEFTPKNIQTRESRNELVFRVRATAPNPDGLLKRGLPVEIWR